MRRWMDPRSELIRQSIRATWDRPHKKPIFWLVVAVFISAIVVVWVKNAYRMAYIRHQSLIRQHYQLETQRRQLLLEYGTWANQMRVHEVAQTQLNMTLPDARHSGILVIPATQRSTSHENEQTTP